MQTTGNAGGVHNLHLKAPMVPHEELMGQMGTGLLITELMGQGVNGVTGDYSRALQGFGLKTVK